MGVFRGITFLIYQSFLLFLMMQLAASSKKPSLGKTTKYPVRFNLESQKYGSLMKVMPDGVIKAEQRHPGLLQSPSVWFYACNGQSIIDFPSNGSLNFSVCHDVEYEKRTQNTPVLVYDQVNDYFKIHPVSKDQMFVNNELCNSSVCLFMPVEADVIGVDDYEDEQFYVIFKPSFNLQDRRTIKVNMIIGRQVYGRVSMIQQPRKWDVYGKHADTLLKIHLEK